jgi:hypothetical protein
MEIYNVDLTHMPVARHRRLRLFLIYFAFCAPAFFVGEWLLFDRAERGISRMAITAVLFSLALSVVNSSPKGMLSTRSWRKYQIVVEEDEIKTRNYESWNWMFSKTIRRSEIRTVIEKEAGLFISSHDRVGTFLWGGIWIPKQLADYEYLRRLMSHWKVKVEESA